MGRYVKPVGLPETYADLCTYCSLGGNIPGNKKENMTYIAGINNYGQLLLLVRSKHTLTAPRIAVSGDFGRVEGVRHCCSEGVSVYNMHLSRTIQVFGEPESEHPRSITSSSHKQLQLRSTLGPAQHVSITTVFAERR